MCFDFQIIQHSTFIFNASARFHLELHVKFIVFELRVGDHQVHYMLLVQLV